MKKRHRGSGVGGGSAAPFSFPFVFFCTSVDKNLVYLFGFPKFLFFVEKETIGKLYVESCFFSTFVELVNTPAYAGVQFF